MSPGVLGAGSDPWSSSRSCLRWWHPAIPLAERGAHDAPRLALGPLGRLTHARALSLPARTDSPRRDHPLHRRPAKFPAWPPPPTFAHFALHRRPPSAHLGRSFPIAGGRGSRRRAASFNAPFSRIALSRDDTKKPSSLSDAGRPGADASRSPLEGYRSRAVYQGGRPDETSGSEPHPPAAGRAGLPAAAPEACYLAATTNPIPQSVAAMKTLTLLGTRSRSGQCVAPAGGK